jgi:hypothetical protein
MNDIEFAPCYLCGGEVTEDFLGRIRCTKCGYDFRTMSIDPDFEPEEDVCEYCNLTPSMNSMAKYGRDFDDLEYEGNMYICQYEDGEIALAYSDGDIENNTPIKYCPICGRKLVEEEI